MGVCCPHVVLSVDPNFRKTNDVNVDIVGRQSIVISKHWDWEYTLSNFENKVYRKYQNITDLMHCGIANRAKCIPECICFAFFYPTMQIFDILLFAINLNV